MIRKWSEISGYNLETFLYITRTFLISNLELQESLPNSTGSPFPTNILMLYPLKESDQRSHFISPKNTRKPLVFCYFQGGYKMGTFIRNGLKLQSKILDKYWSVFRTLLFERTIKHLKKEFKTSSLSLIVKKLY